MKVVVIALLTALCGLASGVNPLTRQDPSICRPSDSFLDDLHNRCPALRFEDPDPLTVCNSNCLGRACDYYDSANFPSTCTLQLEEFCQRGGASVPSACQSNQCSISTAFALELVNECPAIVNNPTSFELCDEDCYGRACEYYEDNSFPSSCMADLARECRLAGYPVPPACGALTLVTFKGILGAVLLLTAFFVF